MATTVDHRKSAPVMPSGGGGSLDSASDRGSESRSGSYADSLDGSIPEYIDLNVVLPDGENKLFTVQSSKQMMDLLVQVAASNRLSPSGYRLDLYNPDTGRPMAFKASQTIGSLRVDTVYLVSKKEDRDKSKRQPVIEPFEITHRLTVNLPRNQKTVLRVSPTMSLAELFKMVCTDKNLDPYKHELRHTTQPDVALNMARSLGDYSLIEISLVNITESKAPGDDVTARSIYDSHWSYSTSGTSMPRNKPPTAPSSEPAREEAQGYMPGMTREKKKKGFLSFFQKRRSSGKFNVSDAGSLNYSASTSSRGGSGYGAGPSPSLSSSTPAHELAVSGTQPQAEVRPQPHLAASRPEADVRGSRPVSMGPSSITPSASMRSGEASRQGAKPPRKKRVAPPPPPTAAAAAAAAAPAGHPPNGAAAAGGVHSRGSSHSSGFDETGMSPLESPTSTRDSRAGAERGAAAAAANGRVALGEGEADRPRDLSPASSTSTGASSSMTKASRKKRKAPPPPQALLPRSTSDVSPAVSVHTSGSTSPASSTPVHVTTASRTHETVTSYGGDRMSNGISLGDDEVNDFDARVSVKAPPVEEEIDNDEGFDTRDLQDALIEELKTGTSNSSSDPVGPPQSTDVQPRSDSAGSSVATLTPAQSPGSSTADLRLSADGATGSDAARVAAPRPCEFVPPPPPETPPTPETADAPPIAAPLGFGGERPQANVEVADISTQVHVSQRDSLCSERSSCSCMHDSDTYEDDVAVDARDPEVVTAHAPTDAAGQKSDVAVFVDEMSKLTQHTERKLQRDTDDVTTFRYEAPDVIPKDDVTDDVAYTEHRAVNEDSGVTVVEVKGHWAAGGGQGVSSAGTARAVTQEVDEDTGSDTSSIDRFVESQLGEEDGEGEEGQRREPALPSHDVTLLSKKKISAGGFSLDFDHEEDEVRVVRHGEEGESDGFEDGAEEDQEEEDLEMVTDFGAAVTFDPGDRDGGVTVSTGGGRDYSAAAGYTPARHNPAEPQEESYYEKYVKKKSSSNMSDTLSAFDRISDDYQGREAAVVVEEAGGSLHSSLGLEPIEEDKVATFSESHGQHVTSVKVDYDEEVVVEVADRPRGSDSDSGHDSPRSSGHVKVIPAAVYDTMTLEEEISFDQSDVTYVDPTVNRYDPYASDPTPIQTDEGHTQVINTRVPVPTDQRGQKQRVSDPKYSFSKQDNDYATEVALIENAHRQVGQSVVYQSKPVAHDNRPRARVAHQPDHDPDPEDETDQASYIHTITHEYSMASRDGAPDDHPGSGGRAGVQAEAAAAVPETRQDEPQPRYASLRDAYRQKQPSQEPETIVIDKSVPIPVFKRPQAEGRVVPAAEVTSSSSRYSSETDVRADSHVTVSPTEPVRPADPQPPTLSAGVPGAGGGGRDFVSSAKRFDRQPLAEPEPQLREAGGCVFRGPRPWSARGLPGHVYGDVSAIQRAPDVGEMSVRVAGDEMVVGESHSQGGGSPGAIEGHSGAGVAIETERMVTRSPQPRSILKQPSVERETDALPSPPAGGGHYHSAVELSHARGASPDSHRDRDQDRHSSVLGLMDDAHRAAKDVTTDVNSNYAATAKGSSSNKKTLQSQYVDLQQQFGRWQKQLVANQSLLAQTSIVGEEDGLALGELQAPASPTEVPHGDGPRRVAAASAADDREPVRRRLELNPDPAAATAAATEAQRTQREAAESYRRLSTPRPFSHRPSDPQGFRPRPAMGATAAFRKQTSLSDATMPPPAAPPPPAAHFGVTAAGGAAAGRPRAPSSGSGAMVAPPLDPREELMLAIRNASGRQVLKKVPAVETNW